MRGRGGIRVLGAFITAAIITAGLVAQAPTAEATHYRASITMGHPQTSILGVTEAEFIEKGCLVSEMSTLGWDAHVITLNPLQTMLTVTVTRGGYYINVVYYTINCVAVAWSTWNQSYRNQPIPLGAFWAVVSLCAGADIRIAWH